MYTMIVDFYVITKNAQLISKYLLKHRQIFFFNKFAPGDKLYSNCYW